MFLQLTLIIILVVVIIADTPMNALIIIVLLINLLYILSHAGIISVPMTQKQPLQSAPAVPQPQPQPKKPASASVDDDPVFNNIYGREWNNYDAYKTPYLNDPPVHVYTDGAADAQLTVDQSSMIYNQRRNRDKRSIDGAITKDVNYYKYHFGDELDMEENKPWWGNNDY